MNSVIIFTDGSSRGNPGPGGYSAIIISNDTVREIGGREDHTTNNRMELRGVIEALRLAKPEDDTIINADSEYVVKGATLWIKGWVAKGWRTAAKKAVLNQDLWQEMLVVIAGKKITWNVVRGHAGVKENERADVIATSFADNAPVNLYNGPKASYPYL